MLCIHIKNTNPFFCLAAEEYLLKNFDEDIFMLWQCENTVVVGKHQNTLAEINYPFVRQNDVTLARRISGGGTVFHDMGNVNFAFIKNVKSPAEISFKQFTRPVVDALAKLDIEATTSGRNDLLVEGLKISGNAEHVYKNRVLHHGTLLFDSDLNRLGDAIKVVPEKYTGKAVQSNRSKVANISKFLKKKINVERFIRFLLDVQLENEENRLVWLKDSDIDSIQNLALEKFETWDWNFAYSPKYEFNNRVSINNKTIDIHLEVKKGCIVSCEISGDYFSAESIARMNIDLVGKRHFFKDIHRVLKSEPDEVVYAFF